MALITKITGAIDNLRRTIQPNRIVASDTSCISKSQKNYSMFKSLTTPDAIEIGGNFTQETIENLSNDNENETQTQNINLYA